MCYHVSSKSFEPHEGFPTLVTFIDFLSFVISFMFFKTLQITKALPIYRAFIWLLSVFLIPIWLASNATPGVPIMGWMIHEDFSTHFVFPLSHSDKSFLLQTEVWNKAQVFFIWTIFFLFTDSPNLTTS